MISTFRYLVLRSVWLETYIYFGESYLIYDLCAMFVAHSDEHGNNLRKFMRLKGSAVVHHILYGSVGFALVTVSFAQVTVWLYYISLSYVVCVHTVITKVWRRGLGDFFVGCVFFNDFSTIFLSFAAILELVSWLPRGNKSTSTECHTVCFELAVAYGSICFVSNHWTSPHSQFFLMPYSRLSIYVLDVCTIHWATDSLGGAVDNSMVLQLWLFIGPFAANILVLYHLIKRSESSLRKGLGEALCFALGTSSS